MITLSVYGNEVPLRLEKLLPILFTLRGQIKSERFKTNKKDCTAATPGESWLTGR